MPVNLCVYNLICIIDERSGKADLQITAAVNVGHRNPDWNQHISERHLTTTSLSAPELSRLLVRIFGFNPRQDHQQPS